MLTKNENLQLPNMGPFPGPNSMLILDSLKIHIGQTITDIVDKHQVLMIYLPPYSPDLCPIEKVLLCFKMCMKRDFQLTGHSYGGTGPPEWPIKKNQKMEKRFPKTNF
jgi:hypothetical protein